MKHITSNKGEGMWWANEKAVMADKVNNRLLSTSLQWLDVSINSQHPHPHSLITFTHTSTLSYTATQAGKGHMDWIHLAPFMYIDTMPLANRSLTQSTPQSCLSYWHKDQFKTYYRHYPAIHLE